MKRITLLPTLMLVLCFCLYAYGEEKATELSSEEKAEIRETIESQLDRVKKEQAEDEFTIKTREELIHEGGRWSFGLDYTNAYSDFDWDNDLNEDNTSTGSDFVTNYNMHGTIISLQYFLLRGATFGRLGFGLRGGYYRQAGEASDFAKVSVYNGGLATSYEFKFTPGQTLVPVVFASYLRSSLNFNGVFRRQPFLADRQAKRVISFGETRYGGGLMINLNRLEANTARAAYINFGIKKVNFLIRYIFSNQIKSVLAGGIRLEY